MQDFDSLFGVVDKTANTVVLTWSLAHLSVVNASTIVSVSLQRSIAGYNSWTQIASATGADIAGSTYTDTLGTEGTYQYRLVVILGTAPHTTELHSNVIAVGTYNATTLSGSVNGAVVTLNWTAGFGDVESTTVERSADGGATFFPVRNRPGTATEYVETLSSSGSFTYRVKVAIEDPERPDAIGKDTIITSNSVTLSVVGTGQD